MLGILVIEELILFWFCRKQYGTTPAWYYYAVMSVAILWAVYGSLLLPRVGMLMGLVGGVCLAVLFPPAHHAAYSIVFNPLFSVGFGFVAALAIAAILVRWKGPREHPDGWVWAVLALTGVVILWIRQRKSTTTGIAATTHRTTG
jgi:drug/metabolite transporter (DMT)-like permease